MSSPWLLVLDPPSAGGDAARTLGGLSLGLRLALDAQAAGAAGVVCPLELRSLLDDRRRSIPVLAAPSEGARLVRVPASMLLHRALLKTIASRDEADREAPAVRDLLRESFALDVPWSFDPIDVTNPAAARRGEALLFRSLRKKEDGWTARFLNRYLSLSLSRWLVKTPLQPNQVSLAILAVGLFGAWLAARGDYRSVVLGAVLFQAQSVLDGCDGEMSRVSHRGSHAGEWLDTIGDDLTNYGFFGGLGLGLYRTTAFTPYLAAGIVTVACGALVSAFEYRYLIRIGSGDLLKYPLSQGQGTGRFAAIQPLFKRDTFVLLTLVACALGLGGPMLCLFALAAIGILIGVIRTELRLARERRLARAPGAAG
ncbi:MAG TPA: CDP-alcohol phosphatidyltransferase family protein [Polyangiaceae bacterium]|jgi:phosphatidylglycerophosphate synthase|nr:CDP-alcohol phosphatidyltransferase family protein [Polyangiaceae bacterium]